METYIVQWTGSCQFEAESPEEAIEMMKKFPDVVIACSSFSTPEQQCKNRFWEDKKGEK